ncbi:MAG: redoxin domain-containing protein [Syntrophomonadaceae bacterium]|jgi:peroxiredoxin
MELIKIGDYAPYFNVKDNNDQNISLQNYKGQRVLLSFHPLAWTPVCADQMRNLENNWQNLQQLNTIPLGFSVDAPPCKKVWAVALNITNLRLPCDFWPHGKIAQDYGVFNEAQGVSERANIIVDENGIVKWVKVYQMQELPDLNEILQILANS